ncbi:uncharacterized protein LOC121247325 [Juglans microcarpa x Juglans regia]|uniref:uncharacterized protein LOC121247325 n=1 Tax=Juglans microcarpa x Juglans regia TaxID=2249226 RepID=UPI001B7ED26A|nr:uncharacterized protein LOC121247325 [Juglans microcarpa x Juglans regia]
MACGRQERNTEGSNTHREQDHPLDGGHDLADTIRQLMEIMKQQQEIILRQNQTFEISGCTEEQKVQYIGHLLQGEVGICWDTKRQLLVRELGNIATLTWDRFKDVFDNRFFPESVKQQKAQEFATLVQGSLTVEQYAAKFMELERFAPHLIATKKMQAQKFQSGLQPRIRSYVAGFCIDNFQELVNVAAITEVEQRNIAAQISMERKRVSPFTMEGSNIKRRIVQGSNKGKGIMPILPATSRKCVKVHNGECKFVLGVCFKCDQPGHMIRECPQSTQGGKNAPNPSNKLNHRPPAQAHVYAITPGDMDEEAP